MVFKIPEACLLLPNSPLKHSPIGPSGKLEGLFERGKSEVPSLYTLIYDWTNCRNSNTIVAIEFTTIHQNCKTLVSENIKILMLQMKNSHWEHCTISVSAIIFSICNWRLIFACRKRQESHWTLLIRSTVLFRTSTTDIGIPCSLLFSHSSCQIRNSSIFMNRFLFIHILRIVFEMNITLHHTKLIETTYAHSNIYKFMSALRSMALRSGCTEVNWIEYNVLGTGMDGVYCVFSTEVIIIRVICVWHRGGYWIGYVCYSH